MCKASFNIFFLLLPRGSSVARDNGEGAVHHGRNEKELGDEDRCQNERRHGRLVINKEIGDTKSQSGGGSETAAASNG